MTQFQTGWLLFALMAALTVFNARKKLPFLPIFSATAWLRFHIWAGLISGAIFVWHAGWPMSRFGVVFTILYVLVMLSGIVGWIWSRTIPKEFAARGGEIIFEQIPARRAALREQAEAIALQSPIVGKFLIDNETWGVAQIQTLKKFVDESAVVDKLVAIAEESERLDFHYSRQLRLKGWLFVHIPLTYSLIVFSVVHIVIAYAFSGGAR